MPHLADLLRNQAAQQPHIPAIVDCRSSQTLSFAELAVAAEQAAAFLHQLGLKAGDSALILQPMSAQLYITLLGMFRLGAVAMFIDPGADPLHIQRCCALSPPKALIATAKAHLLRLKFAALRQIPLKVAIGLPVPGAFYWSLSDRLPALLPDLSSAETPALLTFTSGSTGLPKAVLRTQGFLIAQHQVLSASLQGRAGGVDLATLPIFVLSNLAAGVTSLIPDVDLRQPGAIHAARLLQRIDRHQPQSMAASPALLQRLVEYAERHDAKLPSFQRIFSGGAPVFPTLLERLQTLAPQAEVTAVYGSTEAEPIAHIAQRQITQNDRIAMQQGQGLLVGQPIADIHLHILPDRWGQPIEPLAEAELTALSLPEGCSGEIVVSGGHVLTGYVNGRGDAETKFRVGNTIWHRTGDAGYLDSQGRLWLLGRCSARVRDAIGIVYPFAVEVAASFVAGIHRTAFVSEADQRWLLVELQPHLSSQAVADCLANLQRQLHWASIDRLQVIQQIPVDRRHNAKIDYPTLRHQIRRL